MQHPDTIDGLFHDGNPAAGAKGTPITAAWLNALMGIATAFSGNDEPPGAGLGGDGDLYICLPTRNIYGPKTAGEWGDAWTQGLPGPRGFRWYWDEGAPGEIVGQLDGDFYLQHESGAVWQRAAGVWAELGNIRGPQVLSAERDPEDDDGRNGDFWINILTLTLYGPKAAGEWGAGQALRGPQGIQGADGAALAAFWADVLAIDESMALAGYDMMNLGDTTAGDLFWTAPIATGKKGRLIYVENTGAAGNVINLACTGGETIEGEASINIPDGTGRTVYSDGANWRILKS